MPICIVMVLDDNLVAQLPSQGFEIIAEDLTHWLIRETRHALETYRDYLPHKAKCDHFPHVLWILPPVHKFFGKGNNRCREKQGQLLQKIAQTYPDMSTLHMLKEWDLQNANLYLYDSDRFTDEGLAKYWALIDAAIR